MAWPGPRPARPEAELRGLQVAKLLRRTVSAIPAHKQLIAVKDLADAPLPMGDRLGQICPDVVFRILKDDTGKLFWAKQWLNDRETLNEITFEIERYVRLLDDKRAIVCSSFDQQFGLIYPFNHDLYESRVIVHQFDIDRHFDASECAEVRRFAGLVVNSPSLPLARLGQLTDFQTAATSQGLLFLDFEPSRHYARSLGGVVIP
jgi:hypothetical protein